VNQKGKFYVVWKGRKPGIYTSWESCSAQVNGFPTARFKAFATRSEAERAFAGDFAAYGGKPASSRKWLFAPQTPIAESYVVDAACSGSPGLLEWRGLHLASGKELFREGPFRYGTNNVGEFLAIVQALILLKKKRLLLPVYSDSRTAIAWVRTGICKTGLRRNKDNTALFDLIAHAESWLADHPLRNQVVKWDTAAWGEIPADFNRK
jgi:ribonuclease HI